MGVLGDFTPAPAAGDTSEPLSFGWYGTQVRVHPEYGELTFLDFVEEVGDLSEDDPRALASAKSLMRQVVHPDDFDGFWRLARIHVKSQGQLAELNNQILAALAERPTGRPGDSSPGPTPTTPSSAGTSFGPGSDVSAASERAVAKLEAQGRPDLALVVVAAQESRSA
jgi:hypothetical protein